MSKIAPLSGFPELLPAQRSVELGVIDRFRRVFELHGYSSIETRAVEPIDDDKLRVALGRQQLGKPAQRGRSAHLILSGRFCR
jgi:hypothetical protein